jgi:hypothetical protein
MFATSVPNVTASAQGFGAKWFIGVSPNLSPRRRYVWIRVGENDNSDLFDRLDRTYVCLAERSIKVPMLIFAIRVVLALILIAAVPYTLTAAILVVFWFDNNFFGMFHTSRPSRQ